MNIVTELGLFQGDPGSVVGFGFQGGGPPSLSKHLSSGGVNAREIQIVFVQMDVLGVNAREIQIVFVQMDVLGDSAKEDTMKMTCLAGTPRVVPFATPHIPRTLPFLYSTRGIHSPRLGSSSQSLLDIYIYNLLAITYP